MVVETTNLHLAKPDYTEPADIQVINSNMDKVDDFAGEINASLASKVDSGTPAEIALPGTAGVSSYISYRKNNFNEVYVYGRAQKSSGMVAAAETVIATLPVGYRPSREHQLNCALLNPNAAGEPMHPGRLRIAVDGTINVHTSQYAQWVYFIATFTTA